MGSFVSDVLLWGWGEGKKNNYYEFEFLNKNSYFFLLFYRRRRNDLMNLLQPYQMVLTNHSKTIKFCGFSRHFLSQLSTYIMKQVRSIQNNVGMEQEINICLGCVKYFMTVRSEACVTMPKLPDRCAGLKLWFPRWPCMAVSIT